MRGGDGEIDDELNRWIGEQLIDGARFCDAKFARLLPRAGEIDVGDGGDVEDGKGLGGQQVFFADGSAADEGDGEGRHFIFLSQRRKGAKDGFGVVAFVCGCDLILGLAVRQWNPRREVLRHANGADDEFSARSAVCGACG